MRAGGRRASPGGKDSGPEARSGRGERGMALEVARRTRAGRACQGPRTGMRYGPSGRGLILPRASTGLAGPLLRSPGAPRASVSPRGGAGRGQRGSRSRLQGAPVSDAAGARARDAARQREPACELQVRRGLWSGVPWVPGGRPGGRGPSEAGLGLTGSSGPLPSGHPAAPTLSSRCPESEFTELGSELCPEAGAGMAGAGAAQARAHVLNSVEERCADPTGRPKLDRKVRTGRRGGEGARE